MKCLAYCSFAALAFASQAYAQDDSAEDDKEYALKTVLVTAEKRSENLQNVAVSVSAFTSTEMEGLKLRESADIAAQIPNLQVTNPSGDGFPIFSLRGVSMNDFSANQSSPVASYVDEVYKGNPAIQGIQMYDLERIEVLRGPQGTLYGKNSTGGAVNFVTKLPGMGSGGYITAGIGNFNRRELKGALDVPLVGDKLGLRVAGTWTEADGWFENVLPDVKDGGAIGEHGVRATLLWQPTSQFEAILRASTSRQEAVSHGIQAFNIVPDGAGGGIYSLYNALGATSAVDGTRTGLDFFEFDSDQDTKRRIQGDALALTVNWDLTDSLTLTSVSSWDDGEFYNPEDVDGTSNQVLRATYYDEATQISQDLRVSSGFNGPFNFIAGVYASKEEVYNTTGIGYFLDLDANTDGVLDYLDCADVLQTTTGSGPTTQAGEETELVLNEFGVSLADFFPAGCLVQNQFDQDRITYAGYFNGTYDLSDNLRFQFGLRRTRDEASLENFSARILGSDGIAIVNTIPGDPVDPYAVIPDRDFVDQEWTGKIGLDYTTDSGTLLYANYNRGYRSGAFNAQGFFDPSEVTKVEPELLDSFEIGLKTRLFHERLQLNAAAFHYVYKNQQFLDVDPDSLAQRLVNIEKSKVSGAEVELVAQLTPALLLNAGVGLLDSEVEEGVLSGVDLSGNPLVLSPDLNANLGLDWELFENSYGRVTVHGDASYTSEQYFDIFSVDRLEQDGYAVLNARVQYEPDTYQVQFALWAKNITNEEYRTSVIDLQSAVGFDYSHIGPPRTFGAEITYRF